MVKSHRITLQETFGPVSTASTQTLHCNTLALCWHFPLVTFCSETYFKTCFIWLELLVTLCLDLSVTRFLKKRLMCVFCSRWLTHLSCCVVSHTLSCANHSNNSILSLAIRPVLGENSTQESAIKEYFSAWKDLCWNSTSELDSWESLAIWTGFAACSHFVQCKSVGENSSALHVYSKSASCCFGSHKRTVCQLISGILWKSIRKASARRFRCLV